MRNSPVRRSRQASRRRTRRQVIIGSWLVLACAVIFITANYLIARDKENRTNQVQLAANGDLSAVISNPDMNEIIINYTGMTISFNPDHHVPNWVAYELTADEARGEEPRYNKFIQDKSVKGCATPDDYHNSGFDRGHMAPAADMKWNDQAMRESFMMTNIVPQANTINRGAWSKIEEKCRRHAEADSAIIIVCGPVLTDPVDFRIGSTGVTVPSRFFKVVLSPYANPPSAIGFLVPNEPFKGGIQACAVPVDSVEAITGIDFFSALPDDIENRLESTLNFNRWSRIK